MRAIRLAINELRRFREPLRIIAPIGLALIPLLYGALYLWSNWDPYGKTDKIPVAVVNQDKPVTAAGELVDAGGQFVQQLRATPKFDWDFVDADTAHDGLVHGRYYFTITIPSNFSSNLVSAQNPIPERATMGITLNDANNYIVGVVAQTAEVELQNQVNSAAHAAYAKAIYGNLSLVKQQLGIAAQGADALVNATGLAQRGSDALGQGIDAARQGAQSIGGSVDKITAATTQLSNGVNALADSAAATLPAAAGALADAADAAHSGVKIVADGTSLATTQADQALSALRQLGANPVVSATPAYSQALSALTAVSQTTRSANSAATDSLTSLDNATAQAQQVGKQSGPVTAAVRSVTSSATALSAAATSVGGAGTQISQGLDAISSGAATLQESANQSNAGAAKIATTVNGAVDKIPDTSPGQTAKAADILGSPVGLTTRNLHPAGVYGRGLAPFFMSIAVWVLGLLAYLFFRPVNLRALANRVNPVVVAVGGWLPVALLGAVGGLILYAAVQFGLGLDPEKPVLLGLLLMLGAVSFVAIDHMLRYTLGVIGDSLSLVLLIVQLTACGGLYPIETTPAPFQAVHPLLPMTYLVQGLRVTVSGGLSSTLIRAFVVLAAFAVAALAVTSVAVWRRQVTNMSQLHPALDV